ncbi:MAG: DNA translocase FtsK [Peptococcaceae bacterium]|nr:DNA translocase FtsK [Peptococcaceae bacterium]
MGGPNQVESHLKQEIAGIFLLALALLGAVCLLDPSVGVVAFLVEKTLRVLAGEGRYLFPFLTAFWGIKLIRGTKLGTPCRAWGGLILLLVALTLLHILAMPGAGWKEGIGGKGGGILGAALYLLFYKSFGTAGTVIILAAFTLSGLILCADMPLYSFAPGFFEAARKVLRRMKATLVDFMFEEITDEKDGAPVIVDYTQAGGEEDGAVRPSVHGPGSDGPEDRLPGGSQRGGRAASFRPGGSGQYGLESLDNGEDTAGADGRLKVHGEYKLPPLSLISRPAAKSKSTRNGKDITENIRILEETLENFGVKAKVTHVSRGPAITRYEIYPPPGVKVSRIVGLADDIALSMASPDVRIEAPVPGKAAVGIEVPNVEITMVHLRELLESEEFRSAASKLTVSLGKDIAGQAIVADLARMPHLLIAGATGSGKSVCLNTMIASILFKATPDQVKFLIIDPKMVELTTYNGIPHLISPVVTDPKKAATALRWAVKEMEYRYELFAAAGVRDIARYNNAPGRKDTGQTLPYIVVIIDELADLMMVAPADVEDSICRLAQMARAAGMHLVIATQRPSVDVITGLIKANIPSRISFAVSSQVDSRTILDMGGAEKLLGKGDMLFFPVGAPKPIRVQGAYLSDREVESLVLFWKKQAEPVYDQSVAGELQRVGPEDNMEDELLPRAVEIFIETGHASISLLQRRLHIGYARAARLVDIMERRGIVGGYEGSKPRPVLMTLEQYESIFKDRKKFS